MSSSTSQAGRRIESLLDEKSFVEIGSLVRARATDFNMKPDDTPSDGVITGYGTIDGARVYVYSQDASVMGGSIGEMHAKKICNLYDLAMKTGTPIIGILDSSGVRLQESTDALNAIGEIYQKASMAKGVVLQIAAVYGNCGGGLSLIPALSDFTFMETKAKLFVNSPDAIPGNYTAKNDTSACAFQSEDSGNADFVGDADTIAAQIRQLVGMLPANNEDVAVIDSTDDLNRAVEGAAGCASDTSILLSNIADDNLFVEAGAAYAKEMVTGFIRLDGITVGCVANRNEVIGEDGKAAEKFDGVLTVKGCRKAADFIYFCDSFGIPVLSITNVKGYEASMCSEKNIARAAAELIGAFTNCDVPRVNLIVGKALGSAYAVMNSKACGCDLTYCWPDAEIGAMESKLAAKLISKDAADINKTADALASLQNSAAGAAAHGYVDGVIEPDDTRKHLIYAFEMLFA